MPRMLWPGLPDATAPGTSISLGGEESLSPRRGLGRGKPAAPLLSTSESCSNTQEAPIWRTSI
jgi:hypothetical protein